MRTSRERSGLTFGAAHNISVRVARAQRDKNYAISIGLLSDYEAIDAPPRHAAKIMTLCILYGMDFFQYLDFAGIHYDESAGSPYRARPSNQRRRPVRGPPVTKVCWIFLSA